MNIFRRFLEPSSQAGLAILTQAAAGIAAALPFWARAQGQALKIGVILPRSG